MSVLSVQTSIHVGCYRHGRFPPLCVFVCVFAAVAPALCVSRGYGILFMFLAASPSGAEPASVDCAFLQWDTAPLSPWRMQASGPRPAGLLCVHLCVCAPETVWHFI